MKVNKIKSKNEGLINNENADVFSTHTKDIETSRERFNRIMKSKLTQDKENAGVKNVKTSNNDELVKKGKEMRNKLNIKESKRTVALRHSKSKSLKENLRTRNLNTRISNKKLHEGRVTSMTDISKEKLVEEPMRDLTPQYDSRKSFYGKARVETDYPEKGSMVLYSYNTPVVGIRDGKVTLLRQGYLGWGSSATTLRHVKDFLQQEGFESGSSKELAKMYPSQQFDAWKRHEEIRESKSISKEKLTGRVLKSKDVIEDKKDCEGTSCDVKQLNEGYIGQTLEDFFDACVDLTKDNIQQVVLCDINEDDFDDSICFNGSYEDLTEVELGYEFHDFDAFGAGITINVGEGDSMYAIGRTYYETVQDFIDDCNEDEVTIFDLSKDEVIFTGDKYELPDDILEMSFTSFDAPKKITINVTCNEEVEDGVEDFDDYEEDGSFDELDESLKITSDISSYKPWAGAVDTFEKIEQAGKVDDLDFLLEDIYPDGITETQLNDILWFDADWVLESLGLKEEEYEEDDYE